MFRRTMKELERLQIERVTRRKGKGPVRSHEPPYRLEQDFLRLVSTLVLCQIPTAMPEEAICEVLPQGPPGPCSCLIPVL